jgi:hypothetical protein
VPLLDAVKGVVRRNLLARGAASTYTQLDKVPDRLTWPLGRVVADPVPRVTALRKAEPVSKLITFPDAWPLGSG